MIEDIKQFMYCCLNPKSEVEITSITQVHNEKQNKEITEEQNKKNLLITPSSKLSLLHLKSLRTVERNQQSIISKNSNLSIITFSNEKVKKNEESNRILDTLIIGTHELELEGEIFFNKKIIIDRIGLKSLGRKNQNGVTIFGISNNENNENSGIDFNLNIPKNKIKNKNNNNNNNNNNIPLFSIEYDKIEEHYILNLLNLDLKMLLYIDYNFLIENDTINNFMIGKVPITINSPKDENDNIFSVIVEGKKYEFNKLKDCPISIGRNNAKINIKNNSISKSHAVIDYQYDNQVICVKDCDSTNGTYFIIGEKCPFIYLLSDLTFKLFDNKFMVKVIYY